MMHGLKFASVVVCPYAGAGFGGSYLATAYANRGFPGPTTNGYFALEFPFAVGLDINLGALTLGARATYRALLRWSEAIVPELPRDPQGNMFDLAASAGVRF